MKQNWTMYIYKLDRRCKSGERLFSTTVWTDRDQAGMQREVNELLMSGLYPVSEFRIEFHSTGMVQDRKTGEFYNPQQAFDNMMNKPEIMAVFKRLAVR